jgi:ATP synthase protein I
MSDQQGGDGSFEQRLRAAESRRTKASADPVERGAEADAAAGPTALGIGLRVGIELVSALVVAVAIGWALDRWLHTLPLFLVLFILLGGAAGILNVWRVMAPRR